MEETPVSDVGADFIGRLVAVRGRVVRLSAVKPIVVRALFRCGTCGYGVTVADPRGNLEWPHSCPQKGCRGNRFTIDHTTAETVDNQRVRLQEMTVGRVPRCVQVEVKGANVERTAAGEDVYITGVVRVLPDAGKSKSKYSVYVDARSIRTIRKTESSGEDIALVRRFFDA